MSLSPVQQEAYLCFNFQKKAIIDAKCFWSVTQKRFPVFIYWQSSVDLDYFINVDGNEMNIPNKNILNSLIRVRPKPLRTFSNTRGLLDSPGPELKI